MVQLQPRDAVHGLKMPVRRYQVGSRSHRVGRNPHVVGRDWSALSPERRRDPRVPVSGYRTNRDEGNMVIVQEGPQFGRGYVKTGAVPKSIQQLADDHGGHQDIGGDPNQRPGLPVTSHKPRAGIGVQQNPHRQAASSMTSNSSRAASSSPAASSLQRPIR